MPRVLIVDDSNFIRELLKKILLSDKDIEIVGEASNGREALDMLERYKPDVVTMDIIMPGVDGVWALEEIMKQRPTPVVIVSSIGVGNSDIMQEAFDLGVADVVLKPENPSNLTDLKNELITKIKSASKLSPADLLSLAKSHYQKSSLWKPNLSKAHQALVIATSAGGPKSLYQIITGIDEKFLGGIVIAQHMPMPFLQPFANHIKNISNGLDVKIASKGDILYSRKCLFSPTDKTLLMRRTKKGPVAEIVDLKTRLQPDINSTIISCAETFHSAMVLVVLSGMGNDGVEGAKIVKKFGGKVIVESEETAGVYEGMPLHVIKSGFYDDILPAHEIPKRLSQYLSGKKISS